MIMIRKLSYSPHSKTTSFVLSIGENYNRTVLIAQNECVSTDVGGVKCSTTLRKRCQILRPRKMLFFRFEGHNQAHKLELMAINVRSYLQFYEQFTTSNLLCEPIFSQHAISQVNHIKLNRTEQRSVVK
jgi:hypothetical protein